MLNQNVAIFARGLVATKTAFDFSGSPTFKGTGGGVKNLYFIQDFPDSGTRDCTKTGIEVANAFTASDQIRVFFYTPHKLVVTTGTTTMVGQLYAGCSVVTTNPVNLAYDPLPLYGVQNKSTMSVRTDIVAKREIS